MINFNHFKNKIMLKKIFSIITTLVFSMNLMAQSPVNEVEMADAMRTNGKIYVVVAVLSVVMAGFIFYLISVDRKLSRLEKEINNEKENK